MTHLSTGQVADLLQVQVHRINYLTRDRQLRPVKGPTGAFVWTYTHVQRAARLLCLPGPTKPEFEAMAGGGDRG